MSSILFSDDVDKTCLDEMVESIAGDAADDEVQNEIHPELAFRYVSNNVLVGTRGAGKTFFVMTQMVKLSLLSKEELPHPISQFYFSSDKEYDSTVAKFETNIDPSLQLIKIKHKDTFKTVRLIEQTKAKFQKHLLKEAEGPRENDEGEEEEGEEEEDPDWIYNALNIPRTCEEVPHTIVFIDDCMNLLHTDKKLVKLLLQNRQPKITYFLALQEITGIPTSIKANMDLFLLFGGYTPQKFSLIIRQIPHGGDVKLLWEKYKVLTKNQYIKFTF
jgi:hypothetical protein